MAALSLAAQSLGLRPCDSVVRGSVRWTTFELLVFEEEVVTPEHREEGTSPLLSHGRSLDPSEMMAGRGSLHIDAPELSREFRRAWAAGRGGL